MSTFLTAQDPTISYTQDAVTPLAGVTEMTVMQRFIVPDGIADPDVFGASNGFFGYRLESSASGLLSCLWRTANPNVNVGTLVATGVQPLDELTVYTRVTLGQTDGVEFYVNGVAAGTTDAGADWVGSTFQLTTSGSTVRDYELLETAIWVDSNPTVADITNSVDPLLQSVAPTNYYNFTGTAGTHADTVVDSVSGNNLTQQTGLEVAPDWPYFVGPVIPPAPSVPANYTRYTTNIATADTGSGSFLEGVTVEDEMLVDIPDAILGEVLEEGGYVTGHILNAVVGEYTLYYYSPSTGDYEDRAVAYTPPPTATGTRTTVISSPLTTAVTSPITNPITTPIKGNK